MSLLDCATIERLCVERSLGTSMAMNTSRTSRVRTAESGNSTEGPYTHANRLTGHAAVVGLQFGDEGKGQIVDLLTRGFDYVVRYNGGANAGHSVEIDNEKFSLHLIPSGILSSDTINVVANGVVIDPPTMIGEIDGLQKRGVTVDHNLRISNRAHVVLPYHKLQDALMESSLGNTGGDQRKIGTTGRGIGPAYSDKALRSTAIRIADLLEARRLRRLIEHIVPIKNAILYALAQHCGTDEQFTPIDGDALIDEYLQYGDRLRPMVCDTTYLLHDAIDRGQVVLFEGANAVLLDIDHGTYPFVTSSHCSSLGVYPGSGVPGGTLEDVIGIVKLYTSRVGGGPFPTELDNETGSRIRDVGREYGTTTGRPRRCGWLDLTAVRYAARVCGVTKLACTGLSVLAGLEALKVCTGYRYRGGTLPHFPADAEVLAAVEPEYEQFPGFPGPVDTCQRFEDLPAEARAYLGFVEEFIGAPVTMACVGRRRDQILFPKTNGADPST